MKASATALYQPYAVLLFRLSIFEALEQFVDQTYAPSWLFWIPACAHAKGARMRRKNSLRCTV
jgi:hypothetical protein